MDHDKHCIFTFCSDRRGRPSNFSNKNIRIPHCTIEWPVPQDIGKGYSKKSIKRCKQKNLDTCTGKHMWGMYKLTYFHSSSSKYFEIIKIKKDR